MLHIVSQSVVESAICWGRSIKTSDSKKHNKLISKAGSVLGTALELTKEENESAVQVNKHKEQHCPPLHYTELKQ